MQDDDEPFDEDTVGGKIYQSGIGRTDEVGPAEYALPRGLPAFEGGDVEFEAEARRVWTSRRGLIGLGIGVCAFGSTAGMLGWLGALDSRPALDRQRPARKPTQPAKRPEWVDYLIQGALKAADGRMDDLVVGYPTFLMVMEAYGEDNPNLWRGMERLAKFAELDRSEKGYEIAKRVIASFRINPPPPHFAYLAADLRDLVRRWERTRGK